jgi:hypothetical protein
VHWVSSSNTNTEGLLVMAAAARYIKLRGTATHSKAMLTSGVWFQAVLVSGT